MPIQLLSARSKNDSIFLTAPGEYEVSGILVTGVRTFHDKKRGAERGRNTVFVTHIDDMAFAHLGDSGHELTAAEVEEIGDIDVLFVPVGGNESLSASEAVAVIAQLEPRIVIPMHYAGEQVVIDQPSMVSTNSSSKWGFASPYLKTN
jgi:L-ascorbate metabolism protein UlaG (beta-lactamase superfamily)